jgi:cobalt-precorrin 5A hydrolase/precorrin-3B C17-methyltransferase
MARGHKVLAFYLSPGGRDLALKLRARYPEAEVMRYRPGEVRRHWRGAGACIFFTSTGIAVRAVAPLLEGKARDPAVLAVDEKGRHVVSLLGGHGAGANRLAGEIAALLGGEAVLTTATDVSGLTPVDVFAGERGLLIENPALLPRVSGRHVERKSLRVYCEEDLELPPDYEPAAPGAADVLITTRTLPGEGLFLRPRRLVLGMGLNSGTPRKEIAKAVDALFEAEGHSPLSLRLIATHEKKKREESLRQYARERGVEVRGFTTGELNSVRGVAPSAHARKALGVQGVAEPAALLASREPGLLVPKRKYGNLTLALAHCSGRTLTVVGTGPGGLEHLSVRALHALRRARAVVGYRPYLKQVEPLLEGKEVVSSAMTQEVERVKRAVEMAASGKEVVLISGGDAGIYGMAGLVYEVIRSTGAPLDVEVVPGISALNACAARLGAPLMHDFCAISLSDRLTPWQLIEERLDAAGRADFVVVLYNPRSRGRKTHIERAQEILLRHKPPETPVGIVRAATREDEEAVLSTLGEMLEHPLDMQCTVIVGNSMSFRWQDRMVTPRGYGHRYAF